MERAEGNNAEEEEEGKVKEGGMEWLKWVWEEEEEEDEKNKVKRCKRMEMHANRILKKRDGHSV